VGKSRLWTFPRSVFFHGPFTHRFCYRALFLFATPGLFGWRLAGLQESKEAGRIAGSGCGFAGFEYSHRLQTRSYAGRVLFEAVEPGGVLFQASNGGERAGGIYPDFYLASREKVEANGLTF